jgi:hypothetical protein
MILSNKPSRGDTFPDAILEISRSKSEICFIWFCIFATLPGFLVNRNNLMAACILLLSLKVVLTNV